MKSFNLAMTNQQVNFISSIKYFVLMFSLLLFSFSAHAQKKDRQLKFEFTFNKAPLELHKNYYLYSASDSISFSKLQLYISNIKYWNTGKKKRSLEKKHHLLDLEVDSSLLIHLQNGCRVDSISFLIGVDSLTNHQGALGGDLDPIHGMYWTWNSGYINIKIEGNSPVCPTRKNKFQFHIGGYHHPNNSIQEVRFKVQRSKVSVVTIALDELLNSINLESSNSIMSPGPEAVRIAEGFKGSIKLLHEE